MPVQEVIISCILLTAAAYLLGSLPFSLIIGRAFYNTDVREHGSRNAGATNTWRVLGWKAGLPVLLLDMSKGFAATFLPLIYSPLTTDPDLLLWFRIICGIAAAIGHIYPLFAGFRGGKAVATLFGVMMGLMALPAVACFLIFLVVFISFRYVSLGSMLAGLSLPLLVFLLSDHPIQLMIISVLVSLLVIITHRKNIGRLIRGEESKLILKNKLKE